MTKKVSEEIIDYIYPTKHIRTSSLKWLIHNSEDFGTLVLAREAVINLLSADPLNPRLDTILKTANTKIRRLS